MTHCLNGELVPTGIRFNYIDGRIRNDAYDLEKAAACLFNNPQVSLGAVASPAEAIMPIPYYNQTSTSQACIKPFVFCPTREQMQELVAKAKSYKSLHFATELRRAMFDLDTLGLRAAGATKYADFRQSDREPDDDDD